jgi:cell division protein FtsZ
MYMDFIIQNALNAEQAYDIEAGLVGQAQIKVVGVGGAGNNMSDWLYHKGVRGAEILAFNTDKQHLDARSADKKLLIGKDVTRGLGAGGFPQVGEQSARESSQEIKEALSKADMVFVCAGMGGGTGTGAAAVVAEIAHGMGAIVIGTVTMPFDIERARVEKAELGLAKLRQNSDSVIVIDNNRLVQIAGNLPIQQAFAVANELIATMIKGIVETIAIPSLVNLDFADVKAIMRQGGVCTIGVGESDSNARVKESVERALNNPLLDVSYDGATGALIHITGGNDLTLEEVNRIGEMVTTSLDAEAQVIWGARICDDMSGKVRVMTIISGVKSPYILGPVDYRKSSPQASYVSEELGIEMLR